MAYLSNQLVSDSFYLSGIVSRGVEELSGEQLEDGFRLLNNVISLLNIDHRFIPYYQSYQFNTVIGQEKNFIPKLLDLQTLTFFLNGDQHTVRFPTYSTSRKNYFGSARAQVNSILYTRRAERTFGGTDVYLYFTPDQVYQCTIFGKFSYDPVLINTDLSTIFDQFFITYLTYELASFICSDYAKTFKPETEAQLKRIKAGLKDLSPPDLSYYRMTNQQGNMYINYGDANIGHLWRP